MSGHAPNPTPDDDKTRLDSTENKEQPERQLNAGTFVFSMKDLQKLLAAKAEGDAAHEAKQATGSAAVNNDPTAQIDARVLDEAGRNLQILLKWHDNPTELLASLKGTPRLSYSAAFAFAELWKYQLCADMKCLPAAVIDELAADPWLFALVQHRTKDVATIESHPPAPVHISNANALKVAYDGIRTAMSGWKSRSK